VLIIYNAEETAVTTGQKPTRIFARRAVKLTGATASRDRISVTTLLVTAGANANSVSSFYVFKRENYGDYLTVEISIRSVDRMDDRRFSIICGAF
jgi:hypothetical protein